MTTKSYTLQEIREKELERIVRRATCKHNDGDWLIPTSYIKKAETLRAPDFDGFIVRHYCTRCFHVWSRTQTREEYEFIPWWARFLFWGFDVVAKVTYRLRGSPNE